VGFDTEMTANSLDELCHLRLRNVTNLMALVDCDRGWSPTRWQATQYPAELRGKISVVHDGVDTSAVHPDDNAVFRHGALHLSAADTVLTYVARNLEPYRGFHVFMRALPAILRDNPAAIAIIVGGDEVSYGKAPPEGGTWRERMLKEIGSGPDMARVHFTGRLSYKDYLSLLQVSTAHVYLTYPFVLSWSMLEAMAAGCALVASSTAPVTEVIEDGVSGLLTDFFDVDGLVRKVSGLLANRADYQPMRARARETVVRHYDLKRVCLPRQVKILQDLL
jgi:glycosyltransferase involved in cell wall biosynthesis